MDERLEQRDIRPASGHELGTGNGRKNGPRTIFAVRGADNASVDEALCQRHHVDFGKGLNLLSTDAGKSSYSADMKLPRHSRFSRSSD
jgi:hypothetical protein